MAPPSLQGLNLIHPPSHSSSSAQDLLSGPPFPDIWNTLVFENDDPQLPEEPHKRHHGRGMDDELDSPNPSESLLHQGHANLIAPPEAQPAFDLNHLLATFTQPGTPSIVQLLALHSAVQGGAPPQSSLSPPTEISSSLETPPAKRARTRKASISSTADSPEDATSLAVSIAEDKRRRNTAASARFRLKKKEREAALETRAKELEGRVNELERECEGLRRENGWLKGLVVGVTGAAQAPPSAASLKRGRDETETA
ncbi:BZIP domain-containing protein [Mycena indigotica]|uniref:BZIP domain-containing protein n=1 Tax=Mycena indigotica TaxID=2126181 RepID=A0A8H6SAB6_9AGAR|nr:BZIP domain-containing protein [Mycena indigotica]KAF7295282.1 BZIP domain-containing protein [Mycena indigotica]